MPSIAAPSLKLTASLAVVSMRAVLRAQVAGQHSLTETFLGMSELRFGGGLIRF